MLAKSDCAGIENSGGHIIDLTQIPHETGDRSEIDPQPVHSDFLDKVFLIFAANDIDSQYAGRFGTGGDPVGVVEFAHRADNRNDIAFEDGRDREFRIQRTECLSGIA